MKHPAGPRSLKDLCQTIRPELAASLINVDFGLLGRTVSTLSQPSTSGKFYFWLSRDAALARAIDIGSIVVARSDDSQELVFAAVNELHAISDVESIISDYREHDNGRPEESERSETAEIIVAVCGVVRTLSAQTRPVTRSDVYFPTALGIQFAFGIVDADGQSAYHGAADSTRHT